MSIGRETAFDAQRLEIGGSGPISRLGASGAHTRESRIEARRAAD
jgi:hypothetical protein